MISLYERTSEPSDWGMEENLFSSGQHEDDDVCMTCTTFIRLSLASLALFILHSYYYSTIFR